MDRTDTVSASQASGGITVDRRPPEFTIEDLLAELRPDEMPDGATMRELCVQAGLTPTKGHMGRVGRLVYDLVAVGAWEYVGKKSVPTIDRATRMVPAYRPVKK